MLVLVAANVMFGVGAGDRIVYFGGEHNDCCDHSGEHHDASDHGRDCDHSPASGGHSAWLHYLPLAISTTTDHDRRHSNDCEHVHLIGHDATAAAVAERAPSAPMTVAIPAFLRDPFEDGSVTTRAVFVDASLRPSLTPSADRSAALAPLLI